MFQCYDEKTIEDMTDEMEMMSNPNLVCRMMMVMSNLKNMMWMVMGKHIVVLVELNCVKRKFANIEEKTLMRVTKMD